MKFGVREICDVTFKATASTTIGTTTFAANQPVLYIDTAKTSSLEGGATTVYAQGGKGNTRLLAWEGEKTMTFTVEDAVLSPLGLSVLSGAGVFEASGSTPVYVHQVVETTTADAAGNVNITATLLGLDAGASALVVTTAATGAYPGYAVVLDQAGAVTAQGGLLSASGGNGSGYVSSAGALTVQCAASGAMAAAGTRVRLDFYVKKTVSTGTKPVLEMQIDAGHFAGYYYVEASTLFRDQATGEDFAAEIIIPRAKIQSNFTFNLASTGDPSTFSFVMDAFPGYTRTDSSKKVLCAIQIIADQLG